MIGSAAVIPVHAWRRPRPMCLALPLCVLALTCAVLPGAGEVLELRWERVAAGETWRVVTCHLVHWNASHLLWDVLTLGVLGVLCERRDRRGTAVALVIAALSIPVAVWWLAPEVHAYRGLSGLDAALFTFLGGRLAFARTAARHLRWAAWIGLAALGTKIAYEQVFSATVFANTGGVFSPVPIAHIAGGAAGLVCVVLGCRQAAGRRFLNR